MDTRPTASGGGGADRSTPRDSSPSTIFDRDTHQPSDVEKTTPATAADDPDAPPDGGLAAWTVVLGGFCTVFASFGWINCTSFCRAKAQNGRALLRDQGVLTVLPRYRNIPRLLSTPSIGVVLVQHGGLDHVDGVIHDVFLGTTWMRARPTLCANF